MLTTTDPLGHVTTNSYDSFGNLVGETDALGNVTSYGYDDNGNRVSETRTRTKADGTQETLVTGYGYDKNGRLVSTTQPDGSKTRRGGYGASVLMETPPREARDRRMVVCR